MSIQICICMSIHIYLSLCVSVCVCVCDSNSSVKVRCSYLRPSCVTCCSVCWRSARRAGRGGWSANWLCESALVSGHCSETWNPGWETSSEGPRGTRACCKQQTIISNAEDSAGLCFSFFRTKEHNSPYLLEQPPESLPADAATRWNSREQHLAQTGANSTVFCFLSSSSHERRHTAGSALFFSLSHHDVSTQCTFTTANVLPEECVVLHTHLPQPFGSAVIWKLESNRAFKLLKLLRRWNEFLFI